MTVKIPSRPWRRPKTRSRETTTSSRSRRNSSIDETRPLLRSDSIDDTSIISKEEEEVPWRLVAGLCLALTYAVDVGALMAQAPLVRLFEEISCAQYWGLHDPAKIMPDGSIPEGDCKINPVQDVVALIVGWQGMWDCLPGMILAIPLGALADKWGRKKVLFMSLIGILLSSSWVAVICYFRLPLIATWISSVFMFCGGGAIVASALLFTMSADVVPSHKRTTVFLWLHASVLVGEMVGPALASWLMRKNVWYPVLLGLSIQASSFLCVAFMPETIRYRPSLPSLLDEEDGDGDEEALPEDSTKPKYGVLSKALYLLRDTGAFVFQDRNIALIVFTFFCVGTTNTVIPLFLQYVSKRYGWSIADSALLGTLRSAVNSALFLVLPYLPFYLSKRFRLSLDVANLHICKVSGILVAVGLLLVSLSPTAVLMIIGLVIFVLGTGYPSIMRSIATTLVGGEKSHELAKLYTTISMIQALGNIVSGPSVPLLFSLGMSWGGAWIGLPFLCATVLYGIMAVLTFFINIPEEAKPIDDQ